MTGTDLALYYANRLQVYLSACNRLPSSVASRNLSDDLVKMYACVLQFLASAIRLYEANATTRTIHALWERSDLENFDNKCTYLYSRLEAAASMCERELSEHDRSDAENWRDSLDKDIQGLNDTLSSIGSSLTVLEDKVDLTGLTVVKNAIYDSYADEDSPRCLQGTREDLLCRIALWADDRDGKLIYWLCGKAGTGKSTVSRTVAHTLKQQGRPVATFFFKRGEADRSNAGLLFPTVARQLADTMPGLSHSIAAALNEDSLLCGSNLEKQFDSLLLQPLKNVVLANMPSQSLALVIDALDECERSTDIDKVLELLARLEHIPSLSLRIFLTSRPDHPILGHFAAMSEPLHHDIKLEEVQATTIEHDIRIFLKDECAKIRRKQEIRNPYDALPADWPDGGSIEALVKLAVPLFIAAVTLCRYISESDPKGRLDDIIHLRNSWSFSGIEGTYLPILKKVLRIGGSDNKRESDRRIKAFRQIVGPIVLLKDPLSTASLSKLLGIPTPEIWEILTDLHSVLDIPTDPNVPVRLFHLAFHDFLLDPQTRDENPVWIDAPKTHGHLAQQCLQLLSHPDTLRQDICDVRRPATLRTHVNKQRVAECIPAAVTYACRYWVQHLAKSGSRISDRDRAHQFLETHLLHWTEALIWLGCDIVQYLETLRSLVQVSNIRNLL